MELKTIEDMVKDSMEKIYDARSDDFRLYGCVLNRLGVNMKDITLYDFLRLQRKKDTHLLKVYQEQDARFWKIIQNYNQYQQNS